MPNAGIHGTRSTIWNSADEESKRDQMTSVTANAASDRTSASQRIAPLRLPSRLGMSSSRIAPASGNAQDKVSITSMLKAQGARLNAQRRLNEKALSIGHCASAIVHSCLYSHK